MDELGSALRHSDDANFRVSPFLYMPDGKLESAVRSLLQTIYCIPPSNVESIFIVFHFSFLPSESIRSVFTCNLNFKWPWGPNLIPIFRGKLLTWWLFSYSILWPTELVQRGDECTRDYLFGIGEERQRSARLTAWFHTPQNYFVRVRFWLGCLTIWSIHDYWISFQSFDVTSLGIWKIQRGIAITKVLSSSSNWICNQ